MPDKIKIIGMGNELFGDDGIGILIAEKLSIVLKSNDLISIESTNWGGFRIIDLLAGYDYAIIIDAISTGKDEIGFITRYKAEDFINSLRMVSFHDINLGTAIHLAESLNIHFPNEIIVFTIEIAYQKILNESISREIKSAAEKCIKLILLELESKYSITSNQPVKF